ncbi:MAG: DUF4203 domain-containing protein [Chthoniobacterales bacterium]|nr:DUF4203 domain-containing protein [Chthoniobacterales bacterium]
MNPQAIPVFSILLGAALLLFGRRLFWLFVAAVGFGIGFELTPHLMQHPPTWLTLAVALGLGVLGAILAVVLQKIAIAVAGFLVGGHVATALFAAFVAAPGQSFSIAFLLGGIIGALLLLAVFGWALIVFSSLAGAQLISSNLHLPSSGTAIVFLGLTIIGIVFQASLQRRRRVN